MEQENGARGLDFDTRTHGDWRYAPFVGSPSTEAAIVVTHRDLPDEHLALCLGCETPLRPMVERPRFGAIPLETLSREVRTALLTVFRDARGGCTPM